MPRYLITKRIDAPTVQDALKNEATAAIVEITDVDDPETIANPIGFGACG